MRSTCFIAGGLLFVAGIARADEPRAGHVRTSVTVEVIDDARQTDDIISRIQAHKPVPTRPDASGKKPPSPPPAKALDKHDRPPVPARTEPPPPPPARERAVDERRHEHRLEHRRR